MPDTGSLCDGRWKSFGVGTLLGPRFLALRHSSTGGARCFPSVSPALLGREPEDVR